MARQPSRPQRNDTFSTSRDLARDTTSGVTGFVLSATTLDLVVIEADGAQEIARQRAFLSPQGAGAVCHPFNIAKYFSG